MVVDRRGHGLKWDASWNASMSVHCWQRVAESVEREWAAVPVVEVCNGRGTVQCKLSSHLMLMAGWDRHEHGNARLDPDQFVQSSKM